MKKDVKARQTTDDGRWTGWDDDGCQPKAIGHLSDSGDLKMLFQLKTFFEFCLILTLGIIWPVTTLVLYAIKIKGIAENITKQFYPNTR